jgi:hypothetical protein
MGLSVPKLRRLMKRGDGPPFVMLGRSMTFRESSIDAWLVKCERESAKILKRNRQMVQKFSGKPREAAPVVKDSASAAPG